MFINALKGVALFGLLGPAVGMLVIALPAMIILSGWSLDALLALIPAVYFIGGIPAAICGLLAGTVRTRLTRLQGSVVAGVMGSACSVGYYLLVFGHNALGRGVALIVAAGFISGLVCGAAFFARPDHSLKRTVADGLQ
jgi:uncharacterized membrane protein YciS (DUF1049 family)